ncbi:MAG: hypothetical protein ACOY4Q_03500 [Bacillota bacterium]
MHLEALEKVMAIARKNPKILLGSGYYQKISTRLGIETENNGDKMVFRADGKEITAQVITPENCREYKCIVKEGKDGIPVAEFVRILVRLLTGSDVPPSPYPGMGQTAEHNVREGLPRLEEKFNLK